MFTDSLACPIFLYQVALFIHTDRMMLNNCTTFKLIGLHDKKQKTNS